MNINITTPKIVKKASAKVTHAASRSAAAFRSALRRTVLRKRAPKQENKGSGFKCVITLNGPSADWSVAMKNGLVMIQMNGRCFMVDPEKYSEFSVSPDKPAISTWKGIPSSTGVHPVESN